MDYQQATQIAQTGGLLLLATCFALAVLYALWPGNRDEFKRAASAPLTDEDDNNG